MINIANHAISGMDACYCSCRIKRREDQKTKVRAGKFELSATRRIQQMHGLRSVYATHCETGEDSGRRVERRNWIREKQPCFGPRGGEHHAHLSAAARG